MLDSGPAIRGAYPAMSGDSDKTNETASGNADAAQSPQGQASGDAASGDSPGGDAPGNDGPSGDTPEGGASPATEVSVAAPAKRKVTIEKRAAGKKSAAKKTTAKRAAGEPAQRKTGKRRIKAASKTAPAVKETAAEETVRANGVDTAEPPEGASRPVAKAKPTRKRKAVASKGVRRAANGAKRAEKADEAEAPKAAPAATEAAVEAGPEPAPASLPESETVAVPEPAPEPAAAALEQRPVVAAGEPAGTESIAVERPSRGVPWLLLLFLAVSIGAGYWVWQEHGSLIMRLAGVTPQEAPSPASGEPLQSAELTELEGLLVQLGLEPGAVDGVVDEQTRQAISAFQELDGLPVDGEPSAAVLDALREVAGFQETDG